MTIDNLKLSLRQRFPEPLVSELSILAHQAAASRSRVAIDPAEHRQQLFEMMELEKKLLHLLDWKIENGKATGNHFASCYAGFQGLSKPLKAHFHVIVKACANLPKRHRGVPRNVLAHEVTKRIGKLLGTHGFKLTLYDSGDYGMRGDFAFAVSHVLSYLKIANVNTRRYLTEAIADLQWEENFMQSVSPAGRKDWKSIQEFLPSRHAKAEASRTGVSRFPTPAKSNRHR